MFWQFSWPIIVWSFTTWLNTRAWTENILSLFNKAKNIFAGVSDRCTLKIFLTNHYSDLSDLSWHHKKHWRQAKFCLFQDERRCIFLISCTTVLVQCNRCNRFSNSGLDLLDPLALWKAKFPVLIMTTLLMIMMMVVIKTKTSDLKQKYCFVCFEVVINMVAMMTIMLMLMMTTNMEKQL